MTRWWLAAMLVATASCHHRVPGNAPFTRYGFPPEAVDSDVFCVEAEANSPSPYVCLHVGDLRRYIRSQRYAE